MKIRERACVAYGIVAKCASDMSSEHAISTVLFQKLSKQSKWLRGMAKCPEPIVSYIADYGDNHTDNAEMDTLHDLIKCLLDQSYKWTMSTSLDPRIEEIVIQNVIPNLFYNNTIQMSDIGIMDLYAHVASEIANKLWPKDGMRSMFNFVCRTNMVSRSTAISRMVYWLDPTTKSSLLVDGFKSLAKASEFHINHPIFNRNIILHHLVKNILLPLNKEYKESLLRKRFDYIASMIADFNSNTFVCLTSSCCGNAFFALSPMP